MRRLMSYIRQQWGRSPGGTEEDWRAELAGIDSKFIYRAVDNIKARAAVHPPTADAVRNEAKKLAPGTVAQIDPDKCEPEERPDGCPLGALASEFSGETPDPEEACRRIRAALGGGEPS